MERQNLNVQKRESAGSRSARRTRLEGNIPAVIYGRNGATAITLNVKELRKALSGKSGHNTLLDLQGEFKGKIAILKNVQHNPIDNAPTHADLLELQLDQKITVQVPLHFTGKAKGIVDGGIVAPLLRELGVESLPNDIPDSIEVDISDLGVGDSLHVADLKLPKGIRAVGDQVTAVISVVAPKEEKVEEVAAAAAEPEVLTAKAPVEGAAPAAGAAPAKGAPAAPAKGAAPAKEKGK